MDCGAGAFAGGGWDNPLILDDFQRTSKIQGGCPVLEVVGALKGESRIRVKNPQGSYTPANGEWLLRGCDVVQREVRNKKQNVAYDNHL